MPVTEQKLQIGLLNEIQVKRTTGWNIRATCVFWDLFLGALLYGKSNQISGADYKTMTGIEGTSVHNFFYLFLQQFCSTIHKFFYAN